MADDDQLSILSNSKKKQRNSLSSVIAFRPKKVRPLFRKIRCEAVPYHFEITIHRLCGYDIKEKVDVIPSFRIKWKRGDSIKGATKFVQLSNGTSGDLVFEETIKLTSKLYRDKEKQIFMKKPFKLYFDEMNKKKRLAKKKINLAMFITQEYLRDYKETLELTFIVNSQEPILHLTIVSRCLKNLKVKGLKEIYLPSKQKENMKNHNIDKNIKPGRNEYKVLLLGPGDVGRSTIFRQFQLEFNPNNIEQHLLSWSCIARSNVITYMNQMLRAAQNFKLETKVIDENVELQTIVSKINNMMNRNKSIYIGSSDLFTPDLANGIKRIWNEEPAIRHVYQKRHEFHMSDSAEYWMNNIDKLVNPNYKCTRDDALHIYSRTTGVVDMTFKYNDCNFTLVDAGGQRNERAKWIKGLEGAGAIIYVASLVEFYQVCFEDNKTNRSHENIKVFSDLLDNELTKGMPFYVYFTKKDLLPAILKYYDVLETFPDAPITLESVKQDFHYEPPQKKELLSILEREEDKITGKPINGIPLEIFKMIFDFCDEKELLYLGSIHSGFYQICSHDSIWKWRCQKLDADISPKLVEKVFELKIPKQILFKKSSQKEFYEKRKWKFYYYYITKLTEATTQFLISKFMENVEPQHNIRQIIITSIYDKNSKQYLENTLKDIKFRNLKNLSEFYKGSFGIENMSDSESFMDSTSDGFSPVPSPIQSIA